MQWGHQGSNWHYYPYLYCDNNHGVIIWSGKVSAQGFASRHNDHRLESAKEAPPSSRFYLSYPTKNAPVSNQIWSVVCLMHWLCTLQIAAEFEANSDIALRLYKCSNVGGVFIMDEADRRNSESRMKNESHLLKKYDLTIAPLCYLSDSFGFEGFVATLHDNSLWSRTKVWVSVVNNVFDMNNT